MSKTTEVLVSMLTDGVGTSPFDSGGTPKFDENGKYISSESGYGRNVERNRGRDFEKELSSAVRFSVRDGKLEIEMEHNIYHWLERRVELDTKLDEIFHGVFLQKVDQNNDKYWLRLMEEFPSWVAEHVATEDYRILGSCPRKPKWPSELKRPGKIKTRKARKAAAAKYATDLALYRSRLNEACRAVTDYQYHVESLSKVAGIYNEGEPLMVNSYNGEDMLSQVIQYVYFTWDHQAYVALQIHGGADVRGGYSTPHIFSISHDDETAIFDHAKGHIYCTGKDHHPAALKMKAFQEAQLALPGVKVETINFDDCNVHGPANWYTDDSCNFYEDGVCGSGHTNLEDRECVDLEAEIDEAEGKELEVGTLVPGDWRPGVVCVLDGKAYCPFCGALLAASD